MTFRALLWCSCISAAMAVPAIPAQAPACVAGQPTAASYTWDFQGEVNAIFKDVQSDAGQASFDAGTVRTYLDNIDMSSQAYGYYLNDLKYEINDIGDELCRLQAIRRVAAPWQRHVIDEIATTTRLMADNAQDAILFLNAKPLDLWAASYRNNLDNLYKEAHSLTSSLDKAVEYPSVSKEYRNLRQGLGVRASS